MRSTPITNKPLLVRHMPGLLAAQSVWLAALPLWLAALSLWLAAPAEAADWQLDAGNQALQPVTDSGQRLATPNLSGFQLGAEAEVQPNLLLGVRWWLPYGKNSPDSGPQGSFEGQGLAATAKWRFPITEHIRPYGRFGVGALWGKASVGDNLRMLQADTATAMLDATGGIELLLPRNYTPGSRWKPTVGLSFELGWLHALGEALTARSDVRPLGGSAPEVELGTLTWSGWTARLGVVVRL